MGLADVRGHPRFGALVAKRKLPNGVTCQWARWQLAPDDLAVTSVDVFTDGAAELHSAWPRRVCRAGWAAVLLVPRPCDGADADYYYLGALFGPVVTEAELPGFLGASRPSAPVAELTAVLTLLKLMGYPLETDGASLRVFADSTYATDLVCLRSRVAANARMAEEARCLASRTAARRALAVAHVKAHSGIPGNELADLAAEIGLEEFVSTAGLLERQSLPRIGCAAQPISLHGLVYWTRVLDEADVEDQSAVSTPGAQDPPAAMRRLRLATANVLTLWPAVDSTKAPSTRRCQLADSIAALGVQVLGVQEARAREPTCRECAGYFMVGAQADDAGGSGVELWLHESLGVRRDMIWCLSAGPRLLVVRVTLWATDLLFVVAHAPHHNPGQTDSAARIRAWWSAFVDDVRRPNVDDLPVIALVDANAKVGSVVTPQIGPAEAVMENVAGTCMREALAELALCAPSTFMGGGPTWGGPMAQWRRIDYVLIPEAWLPACRETFTGEAGLLALADREDHRLAGATIELRARCRGSTCRGRSGRTVACNRAALRLPGVAEAVEREWGSAPPMPDLWPADLKERALTAKSHALMRAYCPASAPAPRREWLTAEAWKAIRGHAAIRKSYFSKLEMVGRCWHAFFFQLWRAAASGSARCQLRRSAAASAAAAAAQEVHLARDLVLCSFTLKSAGHDAAQLARRDKAKWLATQAEEIADDCGPGAGRKLWDLARRLTGKKRGKRGLIPVLRDADGAVVQDSDHLARMWERKFLGEFLGRGAILEPEAYDARLTLAAHAEPP